MSNLSTLTDATDEGDELLEDNSASQVPSERLDESGQTSAVQRLLRETRTVLEQLDTYDVSHEAAVGYLLYVLGMEMVVDGIRAIKPPKKVCPINRQGLAQYILSSAARQRRELSPAVSALVRNAQNTALHAAYLEQELAEIDAANALA